MDINWKAVELVIFDVDGTLYDQSKMRKKMMVSLISHYALRPWKIKDFLILHHFREEREKKIGAKLNIEENQYLWCAKKINAPISRIKEVVNFWMFSYPNKYLQKCMYPGVKPFFDVLKQNNIKVGIYSDYQAVDKLNAMQLEADLVVCSTDQEIDELKPNPKGLEYISNKLGIPPENCLFIGDRQELDGECAIKAGMPYLILKKSKEEKENFYNSLKKQVSECSLLMAAI